MAVQFENWGESFWRSYNMAADAKSRRLEYAKWVQDKLDREQADTVLRETLKPAESTQAKVAELQRQSTELGDAYQQAQKALDEARATGKLEDGAWATESARLKEQHDAQMGPISNQLANEASNYATFLADSAMNLTRSGGSNPYIADAAKNLFSASNNIGATLFQVQAGREEIVGQTSRELAKQTEIRGTEMVKGGIKSQLEDQRQSNRLEIEGRRDARAAAKEGAKGAGGGLKPQDVFRLRKEAFDYADKMVEDENAKPEERDSLARRRLQEIAPEIADQAMPAPAQPEPAPQQATPQSALDAKLAEVEAALAKVNEELSRTRSLAGLDKGSAEEAKRRNPQFSYDEGKIKSLLETKARYESILTKYRTDQANTAEANRQANFAGYLNDIDSLVGELEKGAP